MVYFYNEWTLLCLIRNNHERSYFSHDHMTTIYHEKWLRITPKPWKSRFSTTVLTANVQWRKTLWNVIRSIETWDVKKHCLWNVKRSFFQEFQAMIDILVSIMDLRVLQRFGAVLQWLLMWEIYISPIIGSGRYLHAVVDTSSIYHSADDGFLGISI